MDVISSFTARFERSREEELSLEDYLAECKRNPLAYATAAERMPSATDSRRRRLPTASNATATELRLRCGICGSGSKVIKGEQVMTLVQKGKRLNICSPVSGIIISGNINF